MSQPPLPPHVNVGHSEEIATVIALTATGAEVRCERRSACSGCAQRSRCASGTVSQALPNHSQTLQITLTEPVAVGDVIRLGINQHGVLRAASWVYLLPLALLLLGAGSGEAVAHALGWGEGLSIAGGVLGCASGFLLLRVISPRLRVSAYLPVMLGQASAAKPTPHTSDFPSDLD
ncbi:MAG: SoxR reducing system RseC family protein [Aeromonas sp.]